MKLGGKSRGDTANQQSAKRNQAMTRQCPECGRKSALKFMSDDFQYGSYCRYDGCGYERITVRVSVGTQEVKS